MKKETRYSRYISKKSPKKFRKSTLMNHTCFVYEMNSVRKICRADILNLCSSATYQSLLECLLQHTPNISTPCLHALDMLKICRNDTQEISVLLIFGSIILFLTLCRFSQNPFEFCSRQRVQMTNSTETDESYNNDDENAPYVLQDGDSENNTCSQEKHEIKTKKEEEDDPPGYHDVQ